MPDIDDPFLEEVEPTAAQVGVDVPGSRSGFTDFINYGVFNGNFRLGPPDPSANVDVVGAAGSNFVPGWRFVQSSNTTITATMVRNTTYPSGSNLRFVFTNSQTGDEAFIEQLIDMGGSVRQDIGAIIRGYMRADIAGTLAALSVSTQYLTSDGTITGMPAERTTALSIPVDRSWLHAAEVDNPPSAARYLRLRLRAKGDTINPTYNLDIPEVRRDRIATIIRLPDRSGSSSTTSMFDVFQSGSNLLWQPSSTLVGTTTTKRLLNYQLVPIPFTVNSIATSATTDMQPFDNAVAQGTARISMGWSGWIVGLSYRMTGAPTGGGANALNVWATVAGAQTWNAFTIASGGSAASQTTQAVGTTGMSFTASQGLGIQLVTNGTYAPNGTRNMSAILWVALEYDGL